MQTQILNFKLPKLRIYEQSIYFVKKWAYYLFINKKHIQLDTRKVYYEIYM